MQLFLGRYRCMHAHPTDNRGDCTPLAPHSAREKAKTGSPSQQSLDAKPIRPSRLGIEKH